MKEWVEAINKLGFGTEVLVRQGILYLGQDLATDDALVFFTTSVVGIGPESEDGQKILSAVREKLGS